MRIVPQSKKSSGANRGALEKTQSLLLRGMLSMFVPSLAQREQDTADLGDLIGKDYVVTSPLWDRMCALQIAECMQSRTMRDKTLAGADSPLRGVKTLGKLLLLLHGLERKQDCDLTGNSCSLRTPSHLCAFFVCQHAMAS